MGHRIIFAFLLFSLSGLLLPPVFVEAQSEPIIPDWFKNNAKWWNEGLLSDSDMINALENLMIQDIIPLDKFVKSTSGLEHQASVPPGGTLVQIPSYQKDVFGLWGDGVVSDGEIVNSIGHLMSEGIINSEKIQDEIAKRAELQKPIQNTVVATQQNLLEHKELVQKRCQIFTTIQAVLDCEKRATDQIIRNLSSGFIIDLDVTPEISKKAVEINESNFIAMTIYHQNLNILSEFTDQLEQIAWQEYENSKTESMQNLTNSISHASNNLKDDVRNLAIDYQLAKDVLEKSKKDALQNGVNQNELDDITKRIYEKYIKDVQSLQSLEDSYDLTNKLVKNFPVNDVVITASLEDESDLEQISIQLGTNSCTPLSLSQCKPESVSVSCSESQCTFFTSTGYQWQSKETNALRYPVSQYSSYDSVFLDIAAEVVEGTSISYTPDDIIFQLDNTKESPEATIESDIDNNFSRIMESSRIDYGVLDRYLCSQDQICNEQSSNEQSSNEQSSNVVATLVDRKFICAYGDTAILQWNFQFLVPSLEGNKIIEDASRWTVIIQLQEEGIPAASNIKELSIDPDGKAELEIHLDQTTEIHAYVIEMSNNFDNSITPYQADGEPLIVTLDNCDIDISGHASYNDSTGKIEGYFALESFGKPFYTETIDIGFADELGLSPFEIDVEITDNGIVKFVYPSEVDGNTLHFADSETYWFWINDDWAGLPEGNNILEVPIEQSGFYAVPKVEFSPVSSQYTDVKITWNITLYDVALVNIHDEIKLKLLIEDQLLDVAPRIIDNNYQTSGGQFEYWERLPMGMVTTYKLLYYNNEKEIPNSSQKIDLDLSDLVWVTNTDSEVQGNQVHFYWTLSHINEGGWEEFPYIGIVWVEIKKPHYDYYSGQTILQTFEKWGSTDVDGTVKIVISDVASGIASATIISLDKDRPNLNYESGDEISVNVP